MPSVLQPWVEKIPIRMQSTLLLSLRGPDTYRCVEVKKVQRWLRGLTFIPGNPDNVKEFMASTTELPSLEEKGALARELEFCTQHFYSHLLHGLEVVAYRYPDSHTAGVAYSLFHGMCSLMHLPIEERDEFEERLRTLDWPAGKQPVDFKEAVEQLENFRL